MKLTRTLFLLILLVAGLALAWYRWGAGTSPGTSTWIHLAEHFEPRPLGEHAPEAFSLVAESSTEPGAASFRLTLAPEDWERIAPGRHRFELPAGFHGAELSLQTELEAGLLGPAFQRVAALSAAELEAFEPDPLGSFFVCDGTLELFLAEPLPEIWLETRIERGATQDGRFRGRVGHYSGDAVAFPVGASEALVVDVPPDAELRFYLAGYSYGRPPDGAPYVTDFRIRLDGELLFEREARTLARSRGAWHSVALPENGRAAARFEFEAEGPPGLAGFFAPRVVRAGARRERDGGRPDIVLVLLDTFRADNLSAWGGDHASAPELDRWAEQSLRFRNTWSSAAWTLPAHASMFTGLWPPEHGATRARRPLSGELVTLAERLGEYGYRTGAVTDSGFVGSAFGMDQGFEWFEENQERDLRHTLASADAFLAADDGRPVFLFVHTYRVHHPYWVGLDADPEPWRELRREVTREVVTLGATAAESLLARADRLRAMYLGAVSGLDGLVGPWLDGLAAEGQFEHGYLVVTSDHGEAFGEHGQIQHGGKLWEEKVRVPLFLFGPGIAAGERSQPASLIDLPRTLAGLAGIAAHESWKGSPLIELELDRPVAAFGEEARGEHERFAGPLMVVERQQKYFAGGWDEVAQGRLESMYDLEQDPEERRPLDAGAAQIEAWRDWLEQRMQPRVRPSTIDLPGDLEAQLRDLGYAGEDG